MGTFNPEHFKDVIGEKIIFEGHPATIIDFVSCYEGDFWRIKIEGEKIEENINKRRR